MRSIVHISDVHFGKINQGTVEQLIKAVHAIRPNLVVVSGDLTQRAKKEQFKEARAFLMALPGPQIVVPGNHDVSLMNPLTRLLHPLRKYKRYITPNLYPFYEDEEIAALGINTARATTTKYGHISRTQLAMIRYKMGPVSENKIKIIVTHHPFDIPPGYKNKRQIVGKAARAMKVLSECGADVFLAGHLHKVFTGDTAERYKFFEQTALIIQAGTATSVKGMNSFNLLQCERDMIDVVRYDWKEDAKEFERGVVDTFRHTDTGWTRAPAASAIPPTILS